MSATFLLLVSCCCLPAAGEAVALSLSPSLQNGLALKLVLVTCPPGCLAGLAQACQPTRWRNSTQSFLVDKKVSISPLFLARSSISFDFFNSVASCTSYSKVILRYHLISLDNLSSFNQLSSTPDQDEASRSINTNTCRLIGSGAHWFGSIWGPVRWRPPTDTARPPHHRALPEHCLPGRATGLGHLFGRTGVLAAGRPECGALRERLRNMLFLQGEFETPE